MPNLAKIRQFCLFWEAKKTEEELSKCHSLQCFISKQLDAAAKEVFIEEIDASVEPLSDEHSPEPHESSSVDHYSAAKLLSFLEKDIIGNFRNAITTLLVTSEEASLAEINKLHRIIYARTRTRILRGTLSPISSQ